MAQIKMDVSEYEAMKENARLLKEALEREKELGKEIDKLNQEKIQALEKVPNKIVYKRTQTIFEEIYLDRDPREIAHDIVRLFERYIGRIEMPRYRASGMQLIEHLSHHISGDKELFFRKSRNKTMPTEEVEYVGFEKYKAEVKKHFKDKLDETTNQILEEYPKVKDELYQARRELSLINKKFDDLHQANLDLKEKEKELLKEIDSYDEENSNLKLKVLRAIRLIKESSNFGFIRVSKILSRLEKQNKDD